MLTATAGFPSVSAMTVPVSPLPMADTEKGAARLATAINAITIHFIIFSETLPINANHLQRE
jgi:hypothetical protein